MRSFHDRDIDGESNDELGPYQSGLPLSKISFGHDRDRDIDRDPYVGIDTMRTWHSGARTVVEGMMEP
jgi:hypothetical protein